MSATTRRRTVAPFQLRVTDPTSAASETRVNSVLATLDRSPQTETPNDGFPDGGDRPDGELHDGDGPGSPGPGRRRDHAVHLGGRNVGAALSDGQVPCALGWTSEPNPLYGRWTNIAAVPAPLTLPRLTELLPPNGGHGMTLTWDGTVLTVAAGPPTAGPPTAGPPTAGSPTAGSPAAGKNTFDGRHSGWLTAYPLSPAQQQLYRRVQLSWRYGWTPPEPLPGLVALAGDDNATQLAVNLDLAWESTLGNSDLLPPLLRELLTFPLPARQDRACPNRGGPNRGGPDAEGADRVSYPRCLRLAYALTAALTTATAAERSVLASLLLSPSSWQLPVAELLAVTGAVAAPAAPPGPPGPRPHPLPHRRIR
jgi:hypothetical protein